MKYGFQFLFLPIMFLNFFVQASSEATQSAEAVPDNSSLSNGTKAKSSSNQGRQIFERRSGTESGGGGDHLVAQFFNEMQMLYNIQDASNGMHFKKKPFAGLMSQIEIKVSEVPLAIAGKKVSYTHHFPFKPVVTLERHEWERIFREHDSERIQVRNAIKMFFDPPSHEMVELITADLKMPSSTNVKKFVSDTFVDGKQCDVQIQQITHIGILQATSACLDKGYNQKFICYSQQMEYCIQQKNYLIVISDNSIVINGQILRGKNQAGLEHLGFSYSKVHDSYHENCIVAAALAEGNAIGNCQKETGTTCKSLGVVPLFQDEMQSTGCAVKSFALPEKRP